MTLNPKSHKYLAALLCLPISLLIFGFTYYFSANSAQVMPFAFKLANPNLFPNDAYIQSLTVFPSLYPKIMAWFTWTERLDIFHFILYLVTRYFFFVFVWLTAKLVLRHNVYAYAACIIAALAPFCAIITPLGKDPLLKAEMYQTAITAPFILMSIWLFLKNKYTPSFIILALIYYLNGLNVNFTIMLFAFAFIAVKNKKAYLKALIAPAIILIPWAYFYFTANSPFLPKSPEFMKILRYWYSEHYFILGRQPEFYAGILSLIPLLALAVYTATAKTKFFKTFKAFLCAFFVMWLTAFIFADLIPVSSITVIQLLRSDSVLCVFGAIALAPFIIKLIKQNNAKSVALAFLFAACALTFIDSIFIFFALFIFISEKFFKSRYTKLTAAAAGIYAIGLLAVMREIFSPMSAVLIFSVLYLTAGKKLNAFYFSRKKICIAFIVIIMAAQYAVITGNRAKDLFANGPSEQKAWIAMGQWIQNNTPESAVFFTPNTFTGFRLSARRTPVFEWLDNTACHWAPGYEKIWVNKLNILLSRVKQGEPNEKPLDGYNRFTEEDFIYLSEIFNARYAVTKAEHKLNFNLIYGNEKFNVYSVYNEADKTIRP